MSTPAEIVGKLLLGGASEAVAFAGGVAIAPTLAPVLQELENTTWAEFPVKPPPALTLASGVSQGQVDEATARQWAKETGFGDAAMSALIDIANTGPALGLAYAAWRRGQLTPAEFTTALKRTGLEPQWYAALRALKDEPLDPSTIANAVHRGIMRDPSLIVREPPTTAGKVEQVPPSTIDPATEAEWSGLNHERLRVEVGTTGLPPGLIQMLQLLNRGEVTIDDVQRAVSQSNLRNEYMDVVLALRRELLTPHNYEEAALRGIITRAEADAGAALHGMEKQDAQLLFEIMGRPLTVHQLVTALERGGTFGGTYTDVPEPYRDAIRRSNIRPEYARLAYANRYSYPSAFVLRSLVQSGDLTEAEGHQTLLDIGWPPALAAKVSAKWAGGSGSAGSQQTKTELLAEYAGGYVTQDELRTTLAALGYSGAALDREVHLADARRNASMRERVVKVIGDAYRMHAIDETAAASELAEVNVLGDAATMLIALWEKERRFTRRELTDRQVASAFKKGLLARDAALAEMEERGFSAEDAARELAI